MSVHAVTDYVVLMCMRAGETLTLLKLQKLLYYVQAWHLAFYGKPLFDGRFQAWVHGPVSRSVYDRFAGSKTLYSLVDESDIRPGFNPDSEIPKEARLHIESVLEEYVHFSGSQLEAMTHSEAPWQNARGACKPAERCETDIDERLMLEFYRARVG